MKASSRTLLIATGLGVAVLVVSGAFAYWYLFSDTKEDLLPTEQSAEDIIAEVSAIMALPLDEKPTVATVTDPEMIKNQPFFSRAKKGDKVLVYLNARRAILYDPVAKKIIDVSPLTAEKSTSQATTTDAVE